MVTIVKKRKKVFVPKIRPNINLVAYHNELEKISDKFIGLVMVGDKITQIVVEDDFGDSEETAPYTELNNKLQELILNPTFGNKE